jgi:hypothetical protein
MPTRTRARKRATVFSLGPNEALPPPRAWGHDRKNTLARAPVPRALTLRTALAVGFLVHWCVPPSVVGGQLYRSAANFSRSSFRLLRGIARHDPAVH